MSEPLENIAPPVESAAVEPESPATLTKVEGALGELRENLEILRACAARLEETAVATAQQISFLPPQVRRLDGKIDGLAASVSEPRLRLALLSLLGIYDLVEPMGRALAQDEAGQLRLCEVVRTQLRQALEENGLAEIPAAGAFDPQLHRALQSVPVDDSARDGHVVAVVRPGFRSGCSVLRYAEVSVGRYVPPEGPPPESPQVAEDVPDISEIWQEE